MHSDFISHFFFPSEPLHVCVFALLLVPPCKGACSSLPFVSLCRCTHCSLLTSFLAHHGQHTAEAERERGAQCREGGTSVQDTPTRRGSDALHVLICLLLPLHRLLLLLLLVLASHMSAPSGGRAAGDSAARLN